MRALPWIVCLAAACDAGAKPEPAKAPIESKPTNRIPERQPAAATDGFKLAYLPADSDVIIHFDVAMLRKNKLWATYENDVRKIIAPGFTGCEYDPLDEASTVDIGVPATSQLTTFVVRGIDRERALACLRSHKGDKAATATAMPMPATTATFDGDYVTLTSTSATRVLTFVDDHTLVMQGSKAPTKQTLQSAIDAGTPLAKNNELAAVLARAKTSSPITAVSRPGSEALTKAAQSSGMKLSFFVGSIDLDAQLTLHYAMDLATAADATSVAAMIKGQLDSPSVKQMFERIETKAQDKTVTLEIVLGETKLANLAGMVRGMMPQD